MRIFSRSQRMCSSSGISCLRLEDGSASKSRFRDLCRSAHSLEKALSSLGFQEEAFLPAASLLDEVAQMNADAWGRFNPVVTPSGNGRYLRIPAEDQSRS